MGQVIVAIGGRNYPLSCRDGDETHVGELAADIALKADGLSRSLGPMSEPRLLLMAALMVADELHDMRRQRSGPASAADNAGLAAADAAAEAVAAAVAVTERLAAERLALLVDRAEALAERLAAG